MKNLAILFGGKSPEHQVSLLSAQNIIKNIDAQKYKLILIAIDKIGQLYLCNKNYLEYPNDAKKIKLKNLGDSVTFLPNQKPAKSLYNLIQKKYIKVDLVFPVLHGANGEDGTIQGLLEFCHIPYVSSSYTSCAVTMDKIITKKILTYHKIKNAKFLFFHSSQKNQINFEKVKKELSLPLFIKPATLGSSVGVSKVTNENEFEKALSNAFAYDNRVLIEEFVKGREIESSVIGYKNPINSKLIGEIISTNKEGFYTYNAKYIDENGAILKIPAQLEDNVKKEIIKTCNEAYQALELDIFARIDGFLTPQNKFYINEVNAIPGFTNISMFPKLFEQSGIDQKKLIEKLIKYCLERFQQKDKLKVSPF